MNLFKNLLLAFFLLFAITAQAAPAIQWNWTCQVSQTTDLYKNKIIWKTLTCDGAMLGKKILENLNINVIYAPVNDPEIRFMPYQAQTSNQLAKLPEIADSLSSQFNVIAGINGGYFYRNDVAKFVDNICSDKTSHPPKSTDSMGDSLLQHDGKNFATNCAFLPGIAQNPRASLILTGVDLQTNKKAPYIALVKPDEIYYQAEKIIPDAIGAGPNLITQHQLTVNDPDENLTTTAEFAANSAVGILNDANENPSQIVFFTVDGNDKSFSQHWPGMNAHEMADFMLNYLHVSNAISMDQGGSTTMYVSSADSLLYPLHVVSNSRYEPNQPRDARNVRNVYDGLFIVVNKNL